jgi:hypothetical protein
MGNNSILYWAKQQLLSANMQPVAMQAVQVTRSKSDLHLQTAPH